MKRGIRYDKVGSVSWSEVEDVDQDEGGDRVIMELNQEGSGFKYTKVNIITHSA